MYEKLEARRKEIVASFKAKGHKFMTKGELKKVSTGSSPHKTKKSKRNSKRPLVLTRCSEHKKKFLQWYFGIYNAYKDAVTQYLGGDPLVHFPPGTYKPPGPFVSQNTTL